MRVPAALLGLVQRGMIMSWSCLPASVGNDPKTQGQDRWQVSATALNKEPKLKIISATSALPQMRTTGLQGLQKAGGV